MQAELELLLMEENDKEVQKSHFNMKQIIDMENDSLTKRKRRKQLKKKQKDVVVEQDDFQVFKLLCLVLFICKGYSTIIHLYHSSAFGQV